MPAGVLGYAAPGSAPRCPDAAQVQHPTQPDSNPAICPSDTISVGHQGACTLAPRRQSSSTMALPMPRVAPVTRAVLPTKPKREAA